MKALKKLESQHIFTSVPVWMFESTLMLGARQIPNFRNESFSEVLLSCGKRFLDICNLNAISTSEYKSITLSVTIIFQLFERLSAIEKKALLM